MQLSFNKLSGEVFEISGEFDNEINRDASGSVDCLLCFVWRGSDKTEEGNQLLNVRFLLEGTSCKKGICFFVLFNLV